MNTDHRIIAEVLRRWEAAGSAQVADIAKARARRWLARYARPMPPPKGSPNAAA